MKTRQKGFIAPLILIIIAVLVLGGGTYVYVQQSNVTKPSDVKIDCAAMNLPPDCNKGSKEVPSVTQNSVTGINQTQQATSSAQTGNATGIVISSPKPNDLVTLPVTVRGQINGNGWGANEGEAGSVQVFDVNGKAISGVGILTATTDWLKLPTSFGATIGDRQMMSSITTNTGYLKFTSKAEKNAEIPKTFTVPIRFK